MLLAFHGPYSSILYVAREFTHPARCVRKILVFSQGCAMAQNYHNGLASCCLSIQLRAIQVISVYGSPPFFSSETTQEENLFEWVKSKYVA